jgi:hypothetical protein
VKLRVSWFCKYGTEEIKELMQRVKLNTITTNGYFLLKYLKKIVLISKENNVIINILVEMFLNNIIIYQQIFYNYL